MKSTIITTLTTLVFGTGCALVDQDTPAPDSSNGDHGDDNPGNNGDPSEGQSELAWLGSYETATTYDFSDATVVGDNSLGDVVAHLLVDELLERSGLPSSLQDAARGPLEDLLLEPVATLVDEYSTPLWKGSDSLLAQVAELLEQVSLVGTIDIETYDQDSGSFTATKEIDIVAVGSIEIPAEYVLGVVGGDTLEAHVSGVRNLNTVLFDEHTYLLRQTSFVETLLLRVAGASDMQSLVARYVDCDALISEVAADGITISLGWGLSFDVGPSLVVDGCESVRDYAVDEFLTLSSETTTPIKEYGSASLSDNNADGVADRITGTDYTAVFADTLASPATLSATRM